MPEISRFYGIVIKMYFADHAPPHFHAEYAEYEARIAIGSLAVLSGNLPPRAMGLVAEWTTLHQKELQELGNARASCSRSLVLRRYPECNVGATGNIGNKINREHG